MDITITRIERAGAGVMAAFTSEFGDAAGLWMGSNPRVGGRYMVEFDINGVLAWNEGVALASAERCHFDSASDGTVIDAVLESLDDDGFAALRMGLFLIILMTTGVPADAVGRYVNVQAGVLQIYPHYHFDE